ncbi:MAG: Fur family transcriptional regulator [Puniceicoccales bacterium]
MSTPSAQNENEDPWTTFRDFLSSRGLRITNQRHAIFQAAYEYQQHFTAEELLDRAREIDSTVSRATIYRTLPILVESGLIREVDIGKDYKYYMAHHSADNFKAQVICMDDDRIYEIDAPFMEWYGKAVAAKLGLEVVSQRLQVQARHRKDSLLSQAVEDARKNALTSGTAKS